jgi:hypothetical protein
MPRAIEMSVYVVRAFVQLREMLASNRELARRFAQLEPRLSVPGPKLQTKVLRSAVPAD